MTQREDEEPDLSPALRLMLTEWRRVRIAEVNTLSRYLGMPTVRVVRGRRESDDDA